jgi:hypothetical protein
VLARRRIWIDALLWIRTSAAFVATVHIVLFAFLHAVIVRVAQPKMGRRMVLGKRFSKTVEELVVLGLIKRLRPVVCRKLRTMNALIIARIALIALRRLVICYTNQPSLAGWVPESVACGKAVFARNRVLVARVSIRVQSRNLAQHSCLLCIV